MSAESLIQLLLFTLEALVPRDPDGNTIFFLAQDRTRYSSSTSLIRRKLSQAVQEFALQSLMAGIRELLDFASVFAGRLVLTTVIIFVVFVVEWVLGPRGWLGLPAVPKGEQVGQSMEPRAVESWMVPIESFWHSLEILEMKGV
jgi:hypothetical protein